LFITEGLSDFDKKWEGRSSPNPYQLPCPDSMIKKDDIQNYPSPWSLFKRIVGWDD